MTGFRFISPAGAWRASDRDEGAAAFARRLRNAAPVERAEIFATALGAFELYANGTLVSRSEDGNRADFLRPGATDVERRRAFLSYDITSLWRRGAGEGNELSAFVARSWFSDAAGGRRDVKPALAAALCLVYADGAAEAVETDERWTASFRTPFVRAGIYWGEERDGRGPQDAAACAGDVPAEPNAAFAGEVTPLEGPGVSLRQDLALAPRAARKYRETDIVGATPDAFGAIPASCDLADPAAPVDLAPGERLVVDFGQNAAAVPEIEAVAAEGVRIEFRGGEALNDGRGERARGCDGPGGSVYRANLRGLADDGALVRYVFAGRGVERYRPSFTFLGYRCAELRATGPVRILSLRSVPVSSVSRAMERGLLRSGRGDVGRLVENARWGMRSNFLSIPTDCPQRDERMGWTADAQVFAPAALRFADVGGFLAKWTVDLRDAQAADPEGLFPAVAPRLSWGASRPGKVGWADAGVAVPWTIWRMTGDTRAVDDNFAAMARYVDRIALTRHRTLDGIQWADWLSDEQITPTGAWPPEHPWEGAWLLPEAQRYFDYLGGCHWLLDARRLAAMAAATGRGADAARYEAMAREARDYLRETFLGPDGGLLAIFRHLQTPAVFALRLGLCEGAAREALAAALVANVEAHGFRVRTGFLGTPLLLDALSDDAGRPDVAYSVLLQEGEPGWLCTVRRGATTMWERWNGWSPEKGFGPAGMNSFNHCAFGCVADWIFGTAAGIRPGPAGGFDDRFALVPAPDPRLGLLEAEFRMKRGTIRSAWRYGPGGALAWDFEVPPGAVAEVSFAGERADFAAGRHHLESNRSQLGGIPS